METVIFIRLNSYISQLLLHFGNTSCDPAGCAKSPFGGIIILCPNAVVPFLKIAYFQLCRQSIVWLLWSFYPDELVLSSKVVKICVLVHLETIFWGLASVEKEEIISSYFLFCICMALWFLISSNEIAQNILKNVWYLFSTDLYFWLEITLF